MQKSLETFWTCCWKSIKTQHWPFCPWPSIQLDTSFYEVHYGKIHNTNTPWFSRPPYHDRSAALRPTARQIWQLWFLWSRRPSIQTRPWKSSVWSFDGSQEPLNTGKGPSAPEVTLHTSRQNYPQYYIRIDWPVTRRWRNVGCETSGMLFSHMAASALTMKAVTIISTNNNNKKKYFFVV